MQNPITLQVQYDEARRQLAQVDGEEWQFQGSATRRPVRQAVARALIALAHALAPPAQRETRTA